MPYKVVISPIAKKNVKESVDFYCKYAPPKIAANFVVEYERALSTLKKNPHFRVYYRDFRGYPFKKYPYIIFYQINEDEKIVLVKAVFHTSQDPGKYKYF